MDAGVVQKIHTFESILNPSMSHILSIDESYLLVRTGDELYLFQFSDPEDLTQYTINQTSIQPETDHKTMIRHDQNVYFLHGAVIDKPY